jgi:hypothetical protein
LLLLLIRRWDFEILRFWDFETQSGFGGAFFHGFPITIRSKIWYHSFLSVVWAMRLFSGMFQTMSQSLNSGMKPKYGLRSVAIIGLDLLSSIGLEAGPGIQLPIMCRLASEWFETHEEIEIITSNKYPRIKRQFTFQFKN